MVVPGDHEVFIDIDDEKPDSKVSTRQRARMQLGIETLERNGATVTTLKETRSRNGGAHIYLHVEVEGWDGRDPVTRCAIQAALGSDNVKELLSLFRVWNKVERPPTTFFEVPETEEQIIGDEAIDDEIPW